MEPYKKRRWRKRSSQESIAFFTCARPGRSVDKTKPVPDKTVHQWVNNLPGPPTAIISLLGRKPPPRGTSEFSFYTFHGRGDTVHERRGKPSWQEWLDHITFLAYKENTFASATIEVAQDQRVISTGPYAIVRHPMYAGELLIFIGTPIALGSYWGLVPSIAVLPVLIWRLLDEERLLSRNLPGYAEYCDKVPWRLAPRIF
jgi:hypothetical protein